MKYEGHVQSNETKDKTTEFARTCTQRGSKGATTGGANMMREVVRKKRWRDVGRSKIELQRHDF